MKILPTPLKNIFLLSIFLFDMLFTTLLVFKKIL